MTKRIAMASLFLAWLVACGSDGPDYPRFEQAALGTDVKISGRAQDYALGEARVRLVGRSQAFDVGQIWADGHFAISLPAEVELPPIDQRLPAEWREMLAPVAQVHGPDSWSEVEAWPTDLRIGNFGLVISALEGGHRRPADLTLTNSDYRRREKPGEVLAVFVWASRDGRLRGVAQVFDASYQHRPSPWELELRRGWNLVASRARSGTPVAEYVTIAPPADLRWVAFDAAAAGAGGAP